MTTKRILLAAVAGISVVVPLSIGAAWAQPATPPTRIRGMIEKVEGHDLTIKTTAGATVLVRLADNAAVTAVVPATAADIKPGLFIGTASVPGVGDAQQAMEVTLFPASMNGTGEGSYAWDLGSNSTMTNGTVGDVVAAQGRTMTVKYKGGEKKVTVPDDVPVVLLKPGADMALVKSGAHVFLAATKGADGTLAAARITVGENGTVPPM